VGQKPSIPWMTPEKHEPLRQGDVLRSSGDSHTGDTKLTDYFLIATADCDLANDKHGGKLLCIPLLPLAEYFQTYRLQQVLRSCYETVGSLIERFFAELPGYPRNLGKEEFHNWLRDPSTTYEAFITNLNIWSEINDASPLKESHLVKRKSEVDRIIHLWQVWREMSLAGEVSLAQSEKLLTRLHQLTNKKTQLLESEFENYYSNPKYLPKDIFLLAEISASTQEIGFVAALRFPELIRVADIQLEESLGHQAIFTRVSRVVYPYNIAVMSQFSNLFTSVGLPNDHLEYLEIARKAAKLSLPKTQT